MQDVVGIAVVCGIDVVVVVVDDDVSFVVDASYGIDVSSAVDVSPVVIDSVESLAIEKYLYKKRY